MERLFKYSIIAGAVIAALFVIRLCWHLGLESFLDREGLYELESIIRMVLNVISYALLLVFFVLLISCHQGTSKFIIPSWMVISACGILIITSLLWDLGPIIIAKIPEAGALLYHNFLLYYYSFSFCDLLIAAAFIWISICFKGIQAHKIAGLAVSGILIISLGIGVLPAEIRRDIYEFEQELQFKIGFGLYEIIRLLLRASYSVFFLSFGLTKAAGFDAVIKPDDSTVKS